MSIHDGHRQRLKKRFLEEGLDNFEKVNVLELLLFYCVPRQDTNPLAHKLLNEFGSLMQVLDAPVHELQKAGLSENAAIYLTMIREVCRYYYNENSAHEEYLLTIEDCGHYLCKKFIARNNETVFLLCMDAKCKVICCRVVSEGSTNSAGVSIRKAVELALNVKATTVILAHNHPQGLAIPSNDDVVTTYRLKQALDPLGVILADHIVVTGQDFVSMVQSNLYNPGDDPLTALGGAQFGGATVY